MLNVEQYEYVDQLTESSGIKVLVHDPDTMPFPEDGGITVAPNTITRLAVKKVSYVKHIPDPRTMTVCIVWELEIL